MISPTTTSLQAKLESLRPSLPKGPSINISSEPGFAVLWSDHNAPQPDALVNGATEEDVFANVGYTLSINISITNNG